MFAGDFGLEVPHCVFTFKHVLRQNLYDSSFGKYNQFSGIEEVSGTVMVESSIPESPLYFLNTGII
jgi:hypothetical protein